MKILDFPIERWLGDWLLEVRARDGGLTVAIFVVDGSFDEVERLTQRLHTRDHWVSAMPVQHLTVEEFEAQFGPSSTKRSARRRFFGPSERRPDTTSSLGTLEACPPTGDEPSRSESHWWPCRGTMPSLAASISSPASTSRRLERSGMRRDSMRSSPDSVRASESPYAIRPVSSGGTPK
jgi:hypothetical protein